MKRFLYLIILSFFYLSAYGQAPTLRSAFTGSNGAAIATIDSFRVIPGQANGTTGGQIQNNMVQADPVGGTNSFGWFVWKGKQTADTSTIGWVVGRKTSPSNVAPVFQDEVMFGLMSDSSLTTGNGYFVGYTQFYVEPQVYFHIYRYTGATGAYGNLLDVAGTLSVGDTLIMETVRDSVYLWKYATTNVRSLIGSISSPTYHYGQGGVYTSQFPTFRLKAFATDAEFPRMDNLLIGRQRTGEAPTPPSVTDAAAPTGTITALTTTGGTSVDTSKSFFFRSVMLDDSALSRAYVETTRTGTSYATFDTLATLSGAQTSYTYNTASLQIRVPTFFYARLKIVDKSGKTTSYADTVVVNVGVVNQKWRSAYYADYNYGGLDPWDVDYSGLTHIIHFGADWRLTSPFFLAGEAGTADSIKLARNQDSLITIAHRNGVKVLLSIVDISANRADSIVADNTKNQLFVDKLIAYVSRKGYDGVDIDWEYPTTADQFDSLVTKIRRGLDGIRPNMDLTFAAANGVSSNYGSGGAQIARIAGMVTQVNLMTYNMSFSTYNGFNSPLKKGECAYDGVSPDTWTAWVISGEDNSLRYGPERAIASGWPKAKLGLGLTLYPFTHTSQTRNVPCGIRTGWYTEPLWETFKSHLDAFPDSVNFDDSAKSSWMSVWVGNEWRYYTWTDSISMQYMAKYVDTLGIGGFFLWELGQGRYLTGSGQTVQQMNPMLQWFNAAAGSRGAGVVSIPATPTLVASPANGATGVDPSAVTLRCRTVSGATTYALQVSTASNFSSYIWNEQGLTDTLKDITQILSNQQGNQTYYWKWAAGNSSGYSPYSTPFSFTTRADSSTASVPTLVYPSANATGVPRDTLLRWNPSIGSTGYQIQVRLADSTSGTLIYDNGGITDTTFQVNALNNSTDYWWRVRSLVSGGTNSNYTTYRKFTVVAQTVTPPVAVSDTKKEYPLVQAVPTSTGYKTSNPNQRKYHFALPALPSLAALDTPRTSNYDNIGKYNNIWYSRDYTGTVTAISAAQQNQILGDLNVTGTGSFGNGLDILGSSNFGGDITITGGEFTPNGVVNLVPANVQMSSTDKVTDLNADLLDGYTANDLIAVAENVSSNIAWKDEFTNNGDVTGQASGATSLRQVGDKLWTAKSFGGGSGNAMIYGGLALTLPIDSNRAYLVRIQPDTSGAAGIARGGWYSFIGNTAGQGYGIPALPVGYNFKIGVKTPSAGDSIVIAQGISVTTAANNPFPVNDSTKIGIWFEIGRRTTSSMDSVYAVVCNGTSKTKQGIVAATANQWYSLSFTVSASSVLFQVYQPSDNYTTPTNKMITTNLPSATATAMPFIGAWNYDKTNTKIVGWDYYQYYKIGVRR